jgi:APA family basic amino acid/polyamine antiporter
VIVLGFLIVGSGDGDPGQALSFREGVTPATAVLGATLLAFYSFVGFETSANVAEETRDPRRAYPRALLGGLLIAGVLYVLVGLAVSMALPADKLTGSPLLAVVDASPVGVPAKLFAAIALVAVANGALLTMIMASRLAYGMARDGLLPAPLARVLPGRRTPGVAILVTTAAAGLLLLTGQLESLAATTVLLLLVVFLSANIAVLVLRRDPVEHDHFRTPWPLPVLGAISCVALATQQEAGNFLRAGILLAVGTALYAAARTFSRRS